jgi:hypothetical protein
LAALADGVRGWVGLAHSNDSKIRFFSYPSPSLALSLCTVCVYFNVL